MKTHIRPILLGSALLCSSFTPVYATGTNAKKIEASVNIGITSDYMWRGVTQNNNNPTLSSGMDLGINNFYAGMWASGVNNAGDSTEVDLYAGYKKEGGRSQLGYELGVISYEYLNLPARTDFTEAYLNLLFLNNLVEVGYAGVIAADDNSVEGDQYVHVTANSRLGPFTASTTIGRTTVNKHNTGDSYTHLRSEVSYDIPHHFGTISLNNDMVDTNGTISDPVTSLSWSKTFNF